MVGMLFLVVPVLPGGSGRGGAGGNRKSLGRMGNVAAGAAADLLGLSIVPAVSGTTGSGKRTSRSRKAARGTDRVAEYENDRGAGAGDRGQGPHHPHPLAAGSNLCSRRSHSTEFAGKRD